MPNREVELATGLLQGQKTCGTITAKDCMQRLSGSVVCHPDCMCKAMATVAN
jgi:hypothetical protein